MPSGAGLELWISTVTEGVRMGFLKARLLFLRAMLVSKVHLAVENLALRQQLAVCKQSVKRPKLRPRDRVFWVWLSRLWPNRHSALAIGTRGALRDGYDERPNSGLHGSV